MIKIRLTRTGKKKQANYRVVVANKDSKRDGRVVERIGHYNPLPNPAEYRISEDRALYWLSVGAQPTDAVRRLLEKQGTFSRLQRLQAGEPFETLVAEYAGMPIPVAEAVIVETIIAEVDGEVVEETIVDDVILEEVDGELVAEVVAEEVIVEVIETEEEVVEAEEAETELEVVEAEADDSAEADDAEADDSAEADDAEADDSAEADDAEADDSAETDDVEADDSAEAGDAATPETESE